MMGISMLTSAIRFCSSSPLRPGKRTSKTKQLGISARGRAKNSWADAKVSTFNPADRIRLPRASRTDRSSSTTKTIAFASAIAFLGVLHESKLKRCAGAVIRYGPKLAAVILNNRATDRQPHPHSLCLGGVESIKDPFHVLWVKTHA